VSACRENAFVQLQILNVLQVGSQVFAVSQYIADTPSQIFPTDITAYYVPAVIQALIVFASLNELDLPGRRFSKRISTGTWQSCNGASPALGQYWSLF
jgi:hypothetical protein